MYPIRHFLKSGLDLDIINNKKSEKSSSSSKGSSGGNFKMLRVPFVSKKKDKSVGKVIKNDLGIPTTASATAPPPTAATSATSSTGTSAAGTGGAPMETFHLQMASEASKKAELDRLERLRQQEERDLAYAIALSKAEAANQQ